MATLDKSIKSIYIIGPVDQDDKLLQTEDSFNNAAAQIREMVGRDDVAIFGNHYWAHLEEGKSETVRFKHIIESDLVIEMRGVFTCKEALKDRQVSEWCRKPTILLTEITSPKKSTAKGLEKFFRLVKRGEEQLNDLLGDVLTNPQKVSA